MEILSGIHSKVQKVNPLTTFRSRASSVSSGCSTPSSASSSPSSESSSNVPSSSSSFSPFSPFHSCSTEQFWNQYRRRPPTTSMTKMLKKALTSRLPSRYQPEFLISDAKHSVVLLFLFLFLMCDSIVIFQREASREPRVPSRFAKPWKSISGSWEQLLERDNRDQDGQRRGEDDCHQDEQRRGEEVCEGARREVHEEKRCAFAQTRNHRLPSIRSWITLTKCQVCTWTIMRRAQNLKLCQQWHSQSDLCNISKKLFALLSVDAFFGAEFEIYESYEISTATCSILILFWLRNSAICEAVLRFHPPSASRMTIKLYRMSLEKVPS